MAPSTDREEAAQTSEPEITATNRTTSSASLKSLGTASDTEGGERPVREKLRNTSIAGVKERIASPDQEMGGTSNNGTTSGLTVEDDRGRLRKKRSFEDMSNDEASEVKVEKHGRKRSGDLTISGTEPEGTWRKTSSESKTGETTEDDGPPAKRSRTPSESESQAEKSGMMSPKGKRGREEFEAEEGDNIITSEAKDALAGSSTKPTEESANKTEEPKSKRTRESHSPEPKGDGAKRTDAKIPQSSGFSNTSTVSPFAALTNSKSPPPTSPPTQAQTSDSAFKASGFGALSGSTTSGFGALGATTKPTSSVFGGVTAAPKPAITGLSNSGSQSSFGGLSSPENKSSFATASASGFGKLGGGFGSGFGSSFAGGSGPKLSGFGGGSGPKITGLSDKPAKPFGAPTDDDDVEGSGDEGEAEKEKVLSPTNEEDKKDERFFEQDVETGEENEETIFVCRAKLYNFVNVGDNKKEWKERGLGNLKLNILKPSTEETEGKKRARFVMRADGSHRVVLNSPVQKELKVGDVKGGKPSNGYVFFMGSLADGQGQLELLQLKMKQPNAEALWDKVQELQQEM